MSNHLKRLILQTAGIRFQHGKVKIYMKIKRLGSHTVQASRLHTFVKKGSFVEVKKAD